MDVLKRSWASRRSRFAPLLLKRQHLQKHEGKSDPLFVNRRGRAFSANKLREKQLHPLLEKLGIPRGGFHSMRHGAADSLLADGATPAVVQRQLIFFFACVGTRSRPRTSSIVVKRLIVVKRGSKPL